MSIIISKGYRAEKQKKNLAHIKAREKANCHACVYGGRGLEQCMVRSSSLISERFLEDKQITLKSNEHNEGRKKRAREAAKAKFT
ncbi:hypothetical protein TNCT_498301 [Trichonephila clavata]|uniref:Uncharacterized protein n=1 Tax=Trichonephila clavata TaxID=2740835 RepID=A0A8X6F788_TRICU|nr:hypothetical protein TNCT_498301 [Trichonephila clavata]